MIRFAQLAIAAGALVAAMPAQAADFIIDTAAGRSSGNMMGNTITYSVASSDKKSTLNVKASAWSRDGNGNYSTGQLMSWGADGLGIYQQGQNEANRGAYHQIDNVDGWEFVVLQFDQAVTLQSATLKAFQLGDRDYVDSDAFIAFGNAGYSTAMTGATLKGFEASLNADNSFNSNSNDFASTTTGAAWNRSLVRTQTQDYKLSPSKAGNVWIIGGSYYGPDGLNDAFKLNSVKVTSGVPEPTTWMTMILGFGVVGAALRRRRGAAKASLA